MKQDFKHIVPLKDLHLTDRFLFDEVMEDAQTQRQTAQTASVYGGSTAEFGM